MFNFQKEVVLNNVSDAKIVVPGGTGTEKPNLENKLRIAGGGEYFAKYIVDGKIYRTLPVKGVPFTLDITPDADILGEHIQINVELGLDNDYRGDYGSALYYFRKPLLIDVQLPAVDTSAPGYPSAADKSAAVDVIYKAFLAAIPQEYRFVDVTKTGEKVTIKGADSYQKVRKVVISKYMCDSRCGGDSEEPVEVDPSNIVSLTRNTVEFGTYEYLLHNLRLPTYENLRFTSPTSPEMPLAGTAYAQYSFAYCVPRGINFGGMSVAGQTNHSTTLHTFFVPVQPNGSGAYVSGNATFEALFTATGDNGLGMTSPFVGLEVSKASGDTVTVLPDSYASSDDLNP